MEKENLIIKVYQTEPFYKQFGNTDVPVAEYLYCVFKNEILIKSNLVGPICWKIAAKIFGDNIIPFFAQKKP